MTKEENSIFKKKLINLVLPIAFQQFMLALVGATDTFMLENISQQSLSAVSLAGQITFIQSLYLAGFSIGLSMFVAQFYGKKDYNSIEKLFGYVAKISIIVSFIFFLISLIIPQYLMMIFTSEQEIIDIGANYLRVISFSFFLNGISQMNLTLLKNIGKTKASTIISFSSVITNIVFNSLLIYGLLFFPRLEAIGAGIATVIARLIEVIWSSILILKDKNIHIKLDDFIKNDKEITSKFWKYSLPVLGNEFVWGVGFSMYSVILGHLGNDAVAANSIGSTIKNLVCCFAVGLGTGGSIMIGNLLGSGNLSLAKEYGRKLCYLAIIIGTITGLFILLLSPLLMMFLKISDTAKEYLKYMLIISSYYMIGKAINCTTISGIFCAGGDSKFGFLCDSVTMWLVTVPLGFLSAFVFKFPVPITYFIISLDEIVKLPFVFIHYKKYRWVKDLTIKN